VAFECCCRLRIKRLRCIKPASCRDRDLPTDRSLDADQAVKARRAHPCWHAIDTCSFI
jgi:hypothetical protein